MRDEIVCVFFFFYKTTVLFLKSRIMLVKSSFSLRKMLQRISLKFVN